MDTNTMMMIALVVAVLIGGVVAVYYTDGLQKISSLLNIGALSSLCKTE